jgi:hypothetical protein
MKDLRDAFVVLENRIKLFVALPIEKSTAWRSNATSMRSAATARPRDWSYYDIGH